MRMLFMGKIKGLNKQEVAKRISEGKVNLSPKPVVKSNFQIIMGQFLTSLMPIILLLLLL